MQKMKKNIYYHYFLFFVIFSKSLKQKCLIPTESCFLDGKKPNIAKLVDINFLADNENFSALKTEPKSMVFEKHAKNGKKIFIIIIFYFL